MERRSFLAARKGNLAASLEIEMIEHQESQKTMNLSAQAAVLLVKSLVMWNSRLK